MWYLIAQHILFSCDTQLKITKILRFNAVEFDRSSVEKVIRNPYLNGKLAFYASFNGRLMSNRLCNMY